MRGHWGIRATVKTKDGGLFVRLQMEDSLVAGITNLGGALGAGKDLLRFEFPKPKTGAQPAAGTNNGGARVSAPATATSPTTQS